MPSSTYSALCAKAAAMLGQLLKRQDYEQLLGLDDVARVADYLRTHPAYAAEAASLDPQTAHRWQIEACVQKVIYDDHVKLEQFAGGAAKPLLKYMMTRFELEYVLAALRALRGGSKPESEPIPATLTQHSKVNFAELLAADSGDAFLGALAGTQYYDIISQQLKPGSEPDYTAIETAFFTRYYHDIYTGYAGAFEPASRDEIRRVTAVRCDLLNIVRIMRIKTRFAGSDVLPYIIPITGRLSRETIMALMAAPDEQAAVSIIDGTYFGAKLPYAAFSNATEYMTEFLWRFYRSELVRSQSIVFVLAYLFLKEAEVRNITIITEGIRYKLPPEQIRQHLSGDAAGERAAKAAAAG